MTADEEIRRAEHAKAILDDPLVRETLDAIKAKVARAKRKAEAAE